MLQKIKQKRAMTLIEILIVVSLVTGLSIALYQSLANGLRVWKKSQQLVSEEDVVIFFDKISEDLRNTFAFTKFKSYGDTFRFSFPTIIETKRDLFSDTEDSKDYFEQIGQVEYYFDSLNKKLIKRQANYSQALNEEFVQERVLVSSVDNVRFQYYYFTDDGEMESDIFMDILPVGVRIEIEFSDEQGKKLLSRYIEIPLKG